MYCFASPTITKIGVVRRLLPLIRRTFPVSWLKLATEVLPWGTLRSMRRISDRVCTIAREVVRHKVELLNAGGNSLAKEIGEGKDLMSVLRKCILYEYAWTSLTAPHS